MKQEKDDLLVKTLERIFSDVQIINTIEVTSFMDNEEYKIPTKFSWYDIIEKLNDNGLQIIYKKDKDANNR